MFQIHLPQLKKYQNIAGIAGCIGFMLGIGIPGIGFLTLGWSNPFGNGTIQIICFLALTGVITAIIIGNLAALLLIRIAKSRHIAQKTYKEGASNGNRDIQS
ncbi:MAG: hypothetical protein OXD54_06990 [Candidatus Poribacteria bacterium]|nr:hypothetical protein [Candidatus Poribacteria bacterium]